MPEPHKRPTLAELAAAAQEASGVDPWACPRCGCKDWRVVNSYMATDKRQRRRVCRNCNQGLMRTSEVPVPDGFRVRVERDEEA